MSGILTKISKEVDILFFHVGRADLFSPIMMVKILRKKTIVAESGPDIKAKDIHIALKLLLKFSYFLADEIVIKSGMGNKFL